MLRFVVFCALLVVGSMPLHADVIHVDSAELQQLRTEGVPVIDVRRPEEWSKTGVIEGSHLLTFFDAKGRYDLGQWMPALAAIAESDRKPVACSSAVAESAASGSLACWTSSSDIGMSTVPAMASRDGAPGGLGGAVEEGRSTVDRR